MYDEFKDRAAFYVVYIAEAHSVDGWQTESNEEAGIRIKQHTQFEERVAAAELCADKLGITIPTLVDGMDDAACKAFSAWPERIYIINDGAKIHYKGGHGPWDFNPDEARASLSELSPPPKSPSPLHGEGDLHAHVDLFGSHSPIV
jgi:hypothetical protein